MDSDLDPDPPCSGILGPQEVRAHWKNSRFFMAKNKIMAFALGRSAEEEHAPGLSELSNRVNGNVGLFFTHEPKANVVQWCVVVGSSFPGALALVGPCTNHQPPREHAMHTRTRAPWRLLSDRPRGCVGSQHVSAHPADSRRVPLRT